MEEQATNEKERSYIGFERKVVFLIPEDGAFELNEEGVVQAIASQTFWVHGYPCKMKVIG